MSVGILVASFGTSYEETRRKCIESIENLVKQKYGEEVFERAFTSNMIRKKLKTRDNLHIHSPQEGLESLRARGFEKIVTLSLHILEGFEYAKLSREYGPVAQPLLIEAEDFTRLAGDAAFNDRKGCDALIFMGHGTEHETADLAYSRLKQEYRKQGIDNIYIGTIDGKVTLDVVMEKIADKGYKSILLKPFMIVAGDHAQNDMASDEEDSWKTVLTEAGYEVQVDLTGMGEHTVVQEMFMDKLAKVL